MNTEQFQSVNKAFSKQSSVFDSIDENNPVILWMRNIVRQHVLKYVEPGMHMLELNAGTGLDAVYFAQKGIHVHATDLSDGMITQLQKKVLQNHLEEFLSVQQCSFTQLDEVKQQKFDHIFSNFGGLNCVKDLKTVTQHFDTLLKKDGMVTFVIMPPICPWEILTAVKGNFKLAFRRFKKNGTKSHIEGTYFNTYYFNRNKVIKSFGDDYKLVSVIGLASLSPPPDKENWVKKHPAFYRLLTKLDEKFMEYFPFNSFADHLIITMKKEK
jgi:ubiquinone/menaquinone biosynthesis C-methylase UbiE